jgi:hypothetical protein
MAQVGPLRERQDDEQIVKLLSYSAMVCSFATFDNTYIAELSD